MDWLDKRKITGLKELINNKNLDVSVFCENLDGISIQGVFPLNITSGRLYKKPRISLN